MDGLATPPLDQLCQSIRNQGKKTRMLQVNLKITNTSSETGGGLEITTIKANGQRALTCVLGGTFRGGSFQTDVAFNANHPSAVSAIKFKPNSSEDLVLRIYMENTDNASYVIVRDSTLGSSNSVALPGAGGAAPVAPVATAVPAASGSLLLVQQSTGYEQWGRPAGMSGSGGCGAFNNGSPVRKFNVSVRITNNTSLSLQPLAILPRATKGDGSKAYVCYYGHSGVVNALAPGQSVDITFAAFVELNEFVKSFYVESEGAKSNTLGF